MLERMACELVQYLRTGVCAALVEKHKQRELSLSVYSSATCCRRP